VIRFRPYRNSDSPALVELWNQFCPDRAVVRPLTVHEFDALVIGNILFDREGMILAESDSGILGFVHAGFGPEQPLGPSHRFDRAMGSIAMLVWDPNQPDPDAQAQLIAHALHYLRRNGAQVIYGGGHFPLNPFYWGIYGGSEFAGVLDDHTQFRAALVAAGFEPVTETLLLELDLGREEPRDPRSTILRRQVRTEIHEDDLPDGWWQALAVGMFRPSFFTLVDKHKSHVVARATTWDFAGGEGIGDGRSRLCIIDLMVEASERRRGLGKHLLSEIARHARGQMADRICIQTPITNLAALGLYQSLGFEPMERAILYRLRADRMPPPEFTSSPLPALHSET
jgi:ribosomal protein S18 acetylase RimI-like enzyme